MQRRLRIAIGAIVWATAIGLPAAQAKLPAGTQLNPGSVKAGGGNYIVIGCVSREGQGAAPTFIVTDSRPTPPVPYRLEGDPELLRMHVGHTVEIGGPVTPATGANASASTLKVQSLTYISTSCQKLK